MSAPKHIGNAADEQAAHEQGADFEAINRSALTESVDAIEVDVNAMGDGLLVTRKNGNHGSLQQSVGELQEGPLTMINAGIFEDPAMNSRVSGDVTRAVDRGKLIFFAMNGRMAAASFGNRIKIMRDTMESAYSCRWCKGTGHSEDICPTCKGDKVGIDGAAGCRTCKVLGYERTVWRSVGKVQCEYCRGVGHPAGIVIPDTAKSAPISGIVVSTGPDCKLLRLGDRVMFSRYSGHELVTPDGEVFHTMHEHEVLELLKELPISNGT